MGLNRLESPSDHSRPLVERLRMNEAVIPLPHTSAWHIQGQLFLDIYRVSFFLTYTLFKSVRCCPTEEIICV